MKLNGISLANLRSHRSLNLIFQKPAVLILGPNASGKTTIIEAIFLASSGDSFRASKIDELIQFGADIARVQAKVAVNASQPKSAENQDNIEIILTRGEVQGKKTAKRIFSLNGVRKQRKAVTGKFGAVVFRPEDMRLIEGSPSRRRDFMDQPLAQLQQSYQRALHTYQQTLIRRNRLLLQIRDGEQPRSTLHFWTESLIKHGSLLQQCRNKLFASFSSVEFDLPFSVEYQPSVISAERIANYADREIAAGHTLIGPHKDDFIVKLEKKLTKSTQEDFDKVDVALFGSRGEQRLAVLWLKFCELAYIDQLSDDRPILLLDDILSELDKKSRQLVINLLPKYQTLITSAHQSVAPEIESVIGQTNLQTLDLK